MFDMFWNHESDGTATEPSLEDRSVMTSSKLFSDYMVYRDGRPFLLVNSTYEQVVRLVDGFNLKSEYHWHWRPQPR